MSVRTIEAPRQKVHTGFFIREDIEHTARAVRMIRQRRLREIEVHKAGESRDGR